MRRQPRRPLVWRLVSFGALSTASALGSLLALPILARAASVDEWAAIAIGQSVGGLGALVVGAGWSVTGPALAAREPFRGQRLLLDSLAARIAAASVALPVVAMVSATIPATTHHALSAEMGFSTALLGFSPVWYAVGTSRPGILLWTDVVPRMLGGVGGALAAALWDLLFLYPLSIAGCFLLSYVSFYVRETWGHTYPGCLRGGFRKVVANASALGTEFASGAYTVGSSALIGLTGTPLTVAHFNIGYRLTAFGSTAIAALSHTVHPWVAQADGPVFVRRLGRSLLMHAALGAVGLAFLSVLGPTLCQLLFGQELAPSMSTMLGMGIFFLLWSLEAVTGRHLLATRGHARSLLITTLLGSLIGAAGLPFTAMHGDTAAAFMLAGALCLTVLGQAIAGRRLRLI